MTLYKVTSWWRVKETSALTLWVAREMRKMTASRTKSECKREDPAVVHDWAYLYRQRKGGCASRIGKQYSFWLRRYFHAPKLCIDNMRQIAGSRVRVIKTMGKCFVCL